MGNTGLAGHIICPCITGKSEIFRSPKTGENKRCH
jgi:hypothetical protein